MAHTQALPLRCPSCWVYISPALVLCFLPYSPGAWSQHLLLFSLSTQHPTLPTQGKKMALCGESRTLSTFHPLSMSLSSAFLLGLPASLLVPSFHLPTGKPGHLLPSSPDVTWSPSLLLSILLQQQWPLDIHCSCFPHLKSGPVYSSPETTAFFPFSSTATLGGGFCSLCFCSSSPQCVTLRHLPLCYPRPLLPPHSLVTGSCAPGPTGQGPLCHGRSHSTQRGDLS